MDLVLEQIKKADDILVIARGMTELKQTGANNWTGRCPFHKEKTASFHVIPRDRYGYGYYKCFGCGAHGDVISLVMRRDGIGFPEAKKLLASSLGLDATVANALEFSAQAVSPAPEKPQVDIAPLVAALNRARDFYYSRLFKDREAQAYLKGRGFTGVTAKRFRIGVSDVTLRHPAAFPGNEFLSPALASSYDGCGLTKWTGSGSLQEVFVNRLMVPICDADGNCRGFNARLYHTGEEGSGLPKYLNSPDSAVFNKGGLLFGLPQAREAITETGRVIVVEGSFDTMRLSQEGFPETVATNGTAMTAVQTGMLHDLNADIYLAYDGDEAGRLGTRRAIEKLAEAAPDTTVYIVTLPEGEDPDSYVLREGAEAFRTLLEAARPAETAEAAPAEPTVPESPVPVAGPAPAGPEAIIANKEEPPLSDGAIAASATAPFPVEAQPSGFEGLIAAVDAFHREERMTLEIQAALSSWLSDWWGSLPPPAPAFTPPDPPAPGDDGPVFTRVPDKPAKGKYVKYSPATSGFTPRAACIFCHGTGIAHDNKEHTDVLCPACKGAVDGTWGAARLSPREIAARKAEFELATEQSSYTLAFMREMAANTPENPGYRETCLHCGGRDFFTENDGSFRRSCYTCYRRYHQPV